MKLDVTGQSIERVSFDYAVTLLTDSGAEFRVETSFSLRTPNGEVLVVDPERPASGAEQLAAILHEMITDACVTENSGVLVLDFVNGTRLEVASNESYEAWAFTGTDGLKIVAQPGGGVSTWGSDL
jgi:hypothetical protein